MGSEAHIALTGGTAGHLERAQARIAELEARWTRFRDGSELCRLNRSPETPVIVSADTYCLLEHAVTAWERTGGAYDPTVLPALRAAGYDRDFRAVTDGPSPLPLPSPGCAEIDLDPRTRCVILPAGVEIDPGGIGKGLAADLVTAELLDAGVAGAMVGLGGDLRVRGEPPDGDVWSLAIEHPIDRHRHLVRLGIADGAVATSSTLRRRWRRGGTDQHHLIDPRSGRPTATHLVAATVVAADGWWAEAATKAVLVGASRPADAVVATVDASGAIDLAPELQAVAA